MKTYELNGFCGWQENTTISVVPCYFNVWSDKDEIDIMISFHRQFKDTLTAFIFYIKNPKHDPFTEQQIQRWFIDHYNIVPSIETLEKLLKAVNFYDDV